MPYVEKKCIFAAELMIKDELWCNGSTTDFGSACVGSSPASSTRNSHRFGGSFFYKNEEVIIYLIILKDGRTNKPYQHICRFQRIQKH